MISNQIYYKYYPDDSKDGTKYFYRLLLSHIVPQFVVLNLGAGPTSSDKCRSLRGKVARVVGADIDPVVCSNEDIDEAFVINDNILPFDNDEFDMIWSDYVLEHVEKPDLFLQEIRRVLKPGGSFFFRTPNKHHYVTLIARFTPHSFHDMVANRARCLNKNAHAPYPTYYRLNSKRDIISHGDKQGFKSHEIQYIEAQPSYLMFNTLAFLFGVLYERIVNSSGSLSQLRANIIGRLY